LKGVTWVSPDCCFEWQGDYGKFEGAGQKEVYDVRLGTRVCVWCVLN